MRKKHVLGLALGVALVLSAASAVEAGDGKWGEHTGDLPFVIGYDKGLEESEFTGKPMLVFFTATW